MTDKEYQEDAEPDLGAGSGGGRSFRGPAAHSGGEQTIEGETPPYTEEKGEEAHGTEAYATPGSAGDTSTEGGDTHSVVTPGEGEAGDVQQ
jgi:hypothetical protein